MKILFLIITKILSNKYFWLIQICIALVLWLIGFLVSNQLLKEIKNSMLSRDAEAITRTINLSVERQAESLIELNESQIIEETLYSLSNSGAQKIEIYDSEGFFIISYPENHTETILEESIQDQLINNSYLVFLLNEENTTSCVIDSYVKVIYDNIPISYLKYTISGKSFLENYTPLKNKIFNQTFLIVLVGFFILSMLIFINYLTNIKKNLKLENQKNILKKTNNELIFATKTEALGAIGAHLVHGLKNSLMEIELYFNDSSNSNDKDAKEIAKKAANKAKATVKDVVKVFQDTNSVEYDEINLNDWIEDLKPQLVKLITKPNINLRTYNKSNSNLTIRQASIGTLVIKNIIQNAVEASISENNINVNIFNQDNLIQIEISDTGPGISEKEIENLFNPSPSEKQNSSGIGLAISRSLMKSIGGDLYHCQDYDHGAKFICTIPT